MVLLESLDPWVRQVPRETRAHRVLLGRPVRLDLRVTKDRPELLDQLDLKANKDLQVSLDLQVRRVPRETRDPLELQEQ